MISGAAQADIAVLVISARKGEFETGFEKGGQTREHATLVKTLGVRKLIVAINKMDDSTVNWSKERYDEIVERVTPFLKQNGYNMKTEVEIIPISGFSGANLKDRVAKTACTWYDGPSLLEYLDSMPSLERKIDAPLLMPVTGKYKDLGTIVTGKIESGQVQKGQNVLVMPNKQAAEILAINIEEAEVKSAIAGDNVRLKLKGVEEDDVATGFVICEPARPVKASTRFLVQLIIFSIRNIMAPGYTAVLHVHAASEEITISRFEALIDKKTGDRLPKKPMFVRQGEVVIAEMECQGTICMEPYADSPALGRFTLRDEGKTIAVGKVLKVLD
jgi:peptide chain release factor subunit 3